MMTNSSTPPTLLIVEDEEAIAQTLLFSLKKQGWQALWANSASAARTQMSELSELSAIILDIGLPDESGLSLCQSIRHNSQHQHVPILFLTAKSDEMERVLGLEVGADDYITKPFSPREVMARILAIWRRQAMVYADAKLKFESLTPSDENTDSHGDITQKLSSGLWHYDAHRYQLSFNDTPISLSPTELALMTTLLAQPSRIFSREQLLSAISDYPEHRLARTIDAHIKSLRHKIGEICPHEVIITHRGIGYSMQA